MEFWCVCGGKGLLLGSKLITQDGTGEDSVDQPQRRRRDSSSSDTRLDFKRIHYNDELFVLISWTQTPINYRWLPGVGPATPLPPARRPSPRARPLSLSVFHFQGRHVCSTSVCLSLTDHASKSVLSDDAPNTLELR